MMPLDATEWANYSCVAAASLRTVYALLAIAGIVLLRIFVEYFGIGVDSWRGRLSLRGMKIAPFVLILWLCSTLLFEYHRRELFLENANLVETGCHMLRDYRYEIPFDAVQIGYKRWYHKRWHDVLVFKANGHRELAVELNHAKYIGNLQKLAPSIIGEHLLSGKRRQ